jgi:hypothetical protein
MPGFLHSDRESLLNQLLNPYSRTQPVTMRADQLPRFQLALETVELERDGHCHPQASSGFLLNANHKVLPVASRNSTHRVPRI